MKIFKNLVILKGAVYIFWSPLLPVRQIAIAMETNFPTLKLFI